VTLSLLAPQRSLNCSSWTVSKVQSFLILAPSILAVWRGYMQNLENPSPPTKKSSLHLYSKVINITPLPVIWCGLSPYPPQRVWVEYQSPSTFGCTLSPTSGPSWWFLCTIPSRLSHTPTLSFICPTHNSPDMWEAKYASAIRLCLFSELIFAYRDYNLFYIDGLFCEMMYWMRPPLRSNGQSSWLQMQGSRVRFPGTTKKRNGSGTGSTQPREYNWGATW
jgi:hypothetical protein